MEAIESKKEMSLDIRKALRTEKAGYFSEVTKALVAVHSGGAISMLTFMGLLAKEKPILETFKMYGFYGFTCFAVGLVAALLAPIVLVDHVTAVREQNGNSKRWIYAAAGIYAVSIASLIGGLALVARGVCVAL